MVTARTFLALLAVLALSASSAAVAQPAVDRSALARFHSQTLGDPAAKVVLVEFLDPACEACAKFHPLVKQVFEAHSGRVRLVLRYAPFHRGAPEVVKLLEAARRQGKYWQALDRLFATQEEWTVRHVANVDLALKALSPLNLDVQRLRQDMRSPDLERIVQQDLQDAKTLEVSGTPHFFVNGRPLELRSYGDLKVQVDRAVQEAYR